MQAAIILAALQKAAQAPAMAGIYVKTVDLAATYDWEHRPVMTIVWSMPDASSWVDASQAYHRAGIQASMMVRPSDTAILLDRALASPKEIDDVMLNAAWQLGAWDLVRLERAPLHPGADWQDPGCGIPSSFGYGYVVGDHPLVTGDQADDETCEQAATHGYITWRFVPLALATPTAKTRWASKDKTLQSDCTRHGAPGAFRARFYNPSQPGTAHEHQYQLGRANHGNRGRADQGRRA